MNMFGLSMHVPHSIDMLNDEAGKHPAHNPIMLHHRTVHTYNERINFSESGIKYVNT